ncbi:MAG: hypothetical protein ACKOTZ_09055 [Chloroflexota bacterium]
MGLGAAQPLVDDPLAPPGAWTTGSGAAGTAEIADGTLQLLVSLPSSATGADRSLGVPVSVLRLEADLTIASGEGSAGFRCIGTGPEGGTLTGMVGADGSWRIGLVRDGAALTIADGRLAAPRAADGGGIALRLAVECAVTGLPEGDRIALWADGRLVADRFTGSARGPWSRAGLEATTGLPPLVATVTDLRILTGGTYRPERRDPALGPLLRLVPAAWRDACRATSGAARTGTVAAVACIPAGAADRADYVLMSDPASLGAAITAIAAGADVPLAGTDCTVGPSDVAWASDGAPPGRLVCFPTPGSPGSRTIAWTDPDRLLLGSATVSAGGWRELHDWWLGAGPEG